MTTPTVTIDMSKECVECGKGGAADNGLCLKCMSGAVMGVRAMNSPVARRIAKRFQEFREKRRKK